MICLFCCCCFSRLPHSRSYIRNSEAEMTLNVDTVYIWYSMNELCTHFYDAYIDQRMVSKWAYIVIKNCANQFDQLFHIFELNASDFLHSVFCDAISFYFMERLSLANIYVHWLEATSWYVTLSSNFSEMRHLNHFCVDNVPDNRLMWMLALLKAIKYRFLEIFLIYGSRHN